MDLNFKNLIKEDESDRSSQMRYYLKNRDKIIEKNKDIYRKHADIVDTNKESLMNNYHIRKIISDRYFKLSNHMIPTMKANSIDHFFAIIIEMAIDSGHLQYDMKKEKIVNLLKDQLDEDLKNEIYRKKNYSIKDDEKHDKVHRYKSPRPKYHDE
jgi:hypothetical protein